MDKLELIREISRATDTKIVLLVIDGLGGLPDLETGKTELEAANTPNLDALATKGICGLSEPISPGITPGSAPGHLALFGYDPVDCTMGRGVLEAVGIDLDLEMGDIAARGNFCTLDNSGLITDRRAGRIATEKCADLCELLDDMDIDGIRVIVKPVKEHRLVVVFRGDTLSEDITDSDPQQTGVAPENVEARTDAAEKTADVVNKFIKKAQKILAHHHPANMVLLRGFSKKPQLPTMKEIYKLKAVAIASYPMYRGLAKTVGMDVQNTGATIEDELTALRKCFTNYDFFFIHIKGTDSAGEDGDYNRKVAVLEYLDGLLPQLIELKPDVTVITGDHSTPATIMGHSWHPVPVVLYSQWCRPDGVSHFSESACILGGLGHLPATDIMPLAMANALKLNKFGA
ncbi:MAG TPA: 2,3-bisphosphoglycerate-independent phosphoglycerate mutase [Dehalococcoidia bacterium]|nr:2,3-bisphosphoglycerate-independent phosphoglycerate mutase [Dehalococcoidia bacterium]